jgi:hypothetical protein
MICDQNARKTFYIKTDNKSLENLVKFIHLGLTITDRVTSMAIKYRLNSGNGFYRSVQNSLSSRLLQKQDTEGIKLKVTALLFCYTMMIMSMG